MLDSYGGHEQSKVKIRYTPISCCNLHLYDLIYDSTSMRRFYEINIGRTTKPTEADYKKLNAILDHSVDAFKGINENLEEGYFIPETPIGKRIMETQSHYLPTRTTVNAWCRNCNVRKGSKPSDSLYEHYKLWCKSFGYNPRNLESYNDILRSQFGVNEGGVVMIDVDGDDKTTATQFVDKLTNTAFDDIEV